MGTKTHCRKQQIYTLLAFKKIFVVLHFDKMSRFLHTCLKRCLELPELEHLLDDAYSNVSGCQNVTGSTLNSQYLTSS